MYELLQHFTSADSVSALILVFNDWRFDSSKSQTLHYYSKLFKPVFDQGNVVVVQTKVVQSNFEEMQDSGSEALQTAFLNTLHKECPATEKVKFLQFLDAKPPKQGVPAPENDKLDILQHSLIAKHNILSYIQSCEPINVRQHLFPLPPTLDTLRKLELEALTREQTSMEETSKKYNEEHATMLAKVRLLQTDRDAKKILLQTAQSAVASYSEPFVDPSSKQVFGDGKWFKFISETKTIVIPEKLRSFTSKLKSRTHNCKVTITSESYAEKSITIERASRMLLFHEWYHEKSWFAEVWLEFLGAEVNSTAISNARTDIAIFTPKVESLTTQVLDEESKAKTKGSDITLLTKEAGARAPKIAILGHEMFDKATLSELLTLVAGKIKQL